jgi:class 3 adenylate cyclase
MKFCPSCGEQNPDKAKFCSECAMPLPAAAPPHQEERKVVTVLFADLVGFTSRSEAMDVEDVRGTLQPYHQLLRKELERFGGTVEKFIGDAVMALFGAPVAHEDDPERAVRAALAIQDAVADLRESDERLDLHVRIGVNTGEALVALGARPSEGEGMASGDVVNTAARLQSAAPVDGVLVGEVTYRATSRVFDYAEAEPIQAKGKSGPVTAWVAIQARSRLGSDVQQAPATPLVGRQDEVELLWSALNRARREQSPQLVTLVGVPGIGKSRLVWELLRRVEDDPELITWRQGRSLPYGEGVAFWALGEMVKAQAGVLHSDSAETTAEKLRAAITDLIPNERDAAWLEGQLRPLLGLETAQQSSGDSQAEAFAAWRRFIETLAERGATVLVFEDLHWADDALLDFIDHLVEWASGVPLLVLCTARPELLERRRGWGGGKPNALTVALSPLSEADTAHLVASLLEQAVLPAETQRALLERAEGNPLYAEEYVRMLIERGVLVRDGRHWRVREGEEVPLPESVQGIIAARLDALSAEEKSVLQAASVMGKVVWLGAVGSIDGVSRWQAEDVLHRLERKEFVRRERQSSVENETEYAFRHILVRDVSYGQIARSQRAEMHERAAEWTESLAGDRDDRVEMVAHHLACALELRERTGEASSEFRERVRGMLESAGDRAWALGGYPRAVKLYRAAVDVARRSGLVSGDLLLRYGRAGYYAFGGDEEVLVSARDLLVDQDTTAAASAQVLLARMASKQGDGDKTRRLECDALRLINGAPPSEEKAFVLSELCGQAALDGRETEALLLGKEALQIAQQLQLKGLEARTRFTVAGARFFLGDDEEGAIADAEAAASMAIELRSGESTWMVGNLSVLATYFGDLAKAKRLRQEGRRLARHYGSQPLIEWLDQENAWEQFRDGEWGEAAAAADEAIDHATDAGEEALAHDSRILRALIALARDDLGRAAAEAERTFAVAQRVGSPLYLYTAAALCLFIDCSADLASAANDALTNLPPSRVGVWTSIGSLGYAAVPRDHTAHLLHIAHALGLQSRSIAAANALACRNYAEAASIYELMEALPDEAYARLHAGGQLIEQGDRVEGEAEIKKSLAFWRRVGATAYISDCEALLARAASA